VSRLFVALWPPAGALAELRALPREEHPGVRWVPPERWHVTLRFLGDADPDRARELLAGAPLPAASAEVGHVLERLGRDVLAVPVRGLERLAAAVAAATAGIGVPPERRRFHGHVTVARIRGGAHGLPPPARPGTGAASTTAFPVTEVALVASEHDEQGLRYRTLATFATAPR